MDNTIDITFVVPAFKPKMKEESLGTLILAKKLLLNGYNVDIVRYWNAKNSPRLDYDSFRNEFVSFIVNKAPKIVSFYCRCEEYHICLDLANRIKKLSPTIKIIFGGPQAELVAKETIRTFNFVDYICCSEGENTITITVTAENGDIKVYTIKVIREESEKEETTQVNYGNYYNNYEDSNDDEEENEVVVTNPVEDDEDEDDSSNKEEDSNLSRIIIIILILLVIAGLIYLIFKDEDDEETKKTNKDINRLKKEKEELDVKEERTSNKSSGKPTNNNKNKKPNNKK